MRTSYFPLTFAPCFPNVVAHPKPIPVPVHICIKITNRQPVSTKLRRAKRQTIHSGKNNTSSSNDYYSSSQNIVPKGRLWELCRRGHGNSVFDHGVLSTTLTSVARVASGLIAVAVDGVFWETALPAEGHVWSWQFV